MQSVLHSLPNGFLGLFLWGCRLFRNGGLCGQWQLKQDLPVLFPQPESRHIDLPEQVKSLLIMRTALAVRVAAVARWIFEAAPLGVQAVPERQFVWSRAAGADAKRNGFVCPIMRTALAVRVATVAKWISGAAPLGVQVVPKR